MNPTTARKRSIDRLVRPAARTAAVEPDLKRLTQEITSLARAQGAHLVGVAPVERFVGAPRGHHPTAFLPDCRSVVVLGCRLLDRGLEHWQLLSEGAEFVTDGQERALMQEYFWETNSHGGPSDLLSMMAFLVALRLQDAGYGAVYVRSSSSDFYGFRHLDGKLLPNHHLFSHRHAAVRAGLGEFGLNNLVITPEYGPRVRFVSVLTAAALASSPLLRKKTCRGVKCGLCLTHCGPEREGVLTLKPEAYQDDHVWLLPPGVTNTQACRDCSTRTHCKGQCQRSCPVGVRV